MKPTKSAVLCCVILMLAPSCDRARKREAQKEALDDINASNRAMTEHIEMTEEGMKVDFDALDTHRRNIEGAADKMGGKLGEALKAVTGMQEELNRLGRECEEASNGFVATLDWQSLAEKRDYEARRQVIKDYISLNEKIMKEFQAYPGNVKIRLDGIGFKGKERENFEKGFTGKLKPVGGLVQTVRQCDIDCSGIAIQIINRLEALGDGWKWDPDSESIEFTDDEDVDWFTAKLAEFQKLGTKQLEAQTQMTRLLKER